MMALRKRREVDPDAPPPKPRVATDYVHYSNKDSTYRPITSLDGTPWELITYYRQMLGEGQSPTPLDTGLDVTLQQYEAVDRLRISVTSDLTMSTDSETGITETTGDAMVYPDTIDPVVGDMFTAILDLNRVAVLVVTEATPLSLYRKPVYEISYKVYGIDSTDMVADLHNKASAKTVFDVDRHNRGEEAVISYTAANVLYNYTELVRELYSSLIDNYYDSDFRTLVYKTDDEVIYDPMVVEFLNRILPRRHRGTNPRPEAHMDGLSPDYLNRRTIWRAILRGHTVGMSKFPRSLVVTDVLSLSNLSLWYTLASSGIPNVLVADGGWSATGATTEAPYVLSNSFYDNNADEMPEFDKMIYSAITVSPILDGDIVLEIEELSGTDIGSGHFYKTILLIWILIQQLKEF